VDKSVRCSREIFSGFNVPKLLKSVDIDRVVQKIKKVEWTFFMGGAQVISFSITVK